MSDGDGKLPTVSVAPMIDVTNRHFRMLIRCISSVPVLWTEMTWDRAILYNAPDEAEYALNKNSLPNGKRPSLESIIGFSDEEHPIVMQLGGSDPEMLRRAAVHAVRRGYDEINLNCGCPAQKRGKARNNYGARLMYEPHTVAACCAAIRQATSGTRVPVTVKCRLGVDERDSFEELREFVQIVSEAGVTHFIVHARKAILSLDTVKNRSVPPLRHDWVLRLIREFPNLRFTLNGGVASLQQAMELMEAGVHGVMLGRRANADPFMFARAELFHGALAGPSRREVIARYIRYCELAQSANWDESKEETLARTLLVPLTGLFLGTYACTKWKQALTRTMQDKHALQHEKVGILINACLIESGISTATLDERPSAPIPRGNAASASSFIHQERSYARNVGDWLLEAMVSEGLNYESPASLEPDSTTNGCCTEEAASICATRRFQLITQQLRAFASSGFSVLRGTRVSTTVSKMLDFISKQVDHFKRVSFPALHTRFQASALWERAYSKWLRFNFSTVRNICRAQRRRSTACTRGLMFSIRRGTSTLRSASKATCETIASTSLETYRQISRCAHAIKINKMPGLLWMIGGLLPLVFAQRRRLSASVWHL
ncbi:hypothetical protein AB1Y20_006254 [Prymnesium parvum]|uniref:DUS-like FMN-binding domain-containing protein n=1 Tax=Prymnesium parvum TaxID=97485 RepID=A0AB34J3L9_PRYPA